MAGKRKYNPEDFEVTPDEGVPQLSVDPKYQTTNPEWGEHENIPYLNLEDEKTPSQGFKEEDIKGAPATPRTDVDTGGFLSPDPKVYADALARQQMLRDAKKAQTALPQQTVTGAPGPAGQAQPQGVSAPGQGIAPSQPQAAPSEAPEQQMGDMAPETPSEAPSSPFVGIGSQQYSLGLPTINPQEVDPLSELNQEHLMYQEDLRRGTINPKTFQSLFNDNNFLGKMGTLFGLMVSGAGAGLLHQPNAILELMNKELDRDFEAQKQSNVNVQNWYRLSQGHQLQQAQIKHLEAQDKATVAHAAYEAAMVGKVPAEIANIAAETAYRQAITKGVPAEVALKEAQAERERYLALAVPSTIGKTEAETKEILTRIPVNVKNMESEVNRRDAETQSTLRDAEIKRLKIKEFGGDDPDAIDDGKNKAQAYYLNDFQNRINSMSDPKQKQQAQAKLEYLKAQHAKDAVDRNSAIIQRLMQQSISGVGPFADAEQYEKVLKERQPQKSIDDNPVNEKTVNDLIVKSRNERELTGRSTKLSEADEGRLKEELEKLRSIRNAAFNYRRNYKQLIDEEDKPPKSLTGQLERMFGGQLNESRYNAIVGPAATQMTTDLARRFNQNEMNVLAGSAYPQWKDWGSSRYVKYYEQMRRFKNAENELGMIKRFPDLVKPFPQILSPFVKREKTSGRYVDFDENGNPHYISGGPK
jgi:hypothetical protein